MNILWAKSGALLPLDTGGKIRSFSMASELARRHKVTLFTYYPEMVPDPHVQLKAPFAHVECLPLDIPERGSPKDILAFAANAFTGVPYHIRKHARPQARHRLKQLLSARPYDALICDFLPTAAILPWGKALPTVIFTHNVEALIWKRQSQTNPNPLWKLVSWRESLTLARAEHRYLNLADHVLTVSPNDREMFLKFLPPEKVTSVPTAVDSDYFRPAQTRSQSQLLVFTGSMDWMPNEDAILFFCSEILPLIQRRIPNVGLLVVGRKPSQKLIRLKEQNAAVQVTGAVDDIRPHVSKAAVYVVPLRIGGGTRIKIFEAMAMGMPVVSTTIGAEGLPVEHGKTIVLADSAQDFANRTIELLLHPVEAERIGRQARLLVQERYGWATATDVLEDVLLEITGTTARAKALQAP